MEWIAQWSMRPEPHGGPIDLLGATRDDLAGLFALLSLNRGAEIGVHEGHYSAVLLDANPNLQLLSVDPWHPYPAYRSHASRKRYYWYRVRAKRRLDPYPGSTVRRAMSLDAVRDVPLGSLDFVYLDGNHAFDFIMRDLIEWSTRVRSRGIVSGHDYADDDPDGGVTEATRLYVRQHGIDDWYTVGTGSKENRSFFWVQP